VPIKDQPKLLEIGKAEVIRNFSSNGKHKVALFGLGPMNAIARQAAGATRGGRFDCAVINPRFTKPLDAGSHEYFGKAAELIVTLEDHALMGGTVRRCSNCQRKRRDHAVVRIGWPDQFIEHATTPDELRNKYGLSVENTVAKVKGAVCGSRARRGEAD